MNDAFKKFDLTGKTAFVTGGGAGLGYFMARGLARSGAKVMIAARREDVLKASAQKLSEESGGNEVLYRSMDLADRASVAAGAQYAIDTLGGVDIFVGNAGVETMEPIEQYKDETNDWMFQVNVFANMALVNHFSPHMRKNKWGRIIFSGSMISKVSSAEEGFGAYSAVKGALNAYMRDAAVELGHDNITVNNVLIGVFMTDMLRTVFDSHGAAPQTIQDLIDMHALGRLGEQEEMEGITQFLASDAAAYLTGAEIPFDGGTTIMMRPHRRA
jgi:NAD(P)-dependent dehydrogenase (short-subunit alcohol dehydrogenase family)